MPRSRAHCRLVRSRRDSVLGGVCGGLGALLLLRTYAPRFGEEAFWPLVVVAVDAVVFVTGRR